MRFQLGIALVISAIAALTAACNWDSHAGDRVAPYLHQAVTVTVQPQAQYRVEREFAGEVQAGQSSQLGFEFAGRVSELLVNIGDEVAAGQVLARLDTQLLESERDELTAQRAELDAELDTTRRNLERIQRLQAERLASERELDELSGRVRMLQASLQRVDAALEANLIRLDKSAMKAPFAATVAERRVDTGAVVSPGLPVFSLVQQNVREVRSGIPLGLARNLAGGDVLTIRSSIGEARGEVISVAPVVDQATRSRTVRVRVQADWNPGELAYVVLETPEDLPGAWLPDSAVTEGVRGTWVVYVAVDAGDATAMLEARSVVVHHAHANQVFVSGALQPGENVVAAGLHRLAPGQRVRLAKTNLIANNG
jgi:RND family efflux transporter MFP subunit